MVNQLVSSPLFGIVLCVVTFWVGTRVNQWLRTPVANPLLIAILLCSVVLLAFRIPLEQFNIGGEIINMLVGPATAALALSIYHQRKVLGKYFLPIVVGSFAGAATSLASVALLCRLFRLDEVILSSLLPKSVTTAIALEISAGRGGIGTGNILAVWGVRGSVCPAYDPAVPGQKSGGAGGRNRDMQPCGRHQQGDRAGRASGRDEWNRDRGCGLDDRPDYPAVLTRSVERCPAPEDCFAGALPLRAYDTGVLSPALPPKRRVGQPVFAPGRSFLGTYSLS